MSSRIGRTWRALATLLWLPGLAVAQDRIFPRVPSFERPEASPRVHGLAGRIISAQRGDSRFGNEAEAEVALGENFPVLALRGGVRPITLGFGSQVYARFSLTDGRDALISNDWVVGLNATAHLEPVGLHRGGLPREQPPRRRIRGSVRRQAARLDAGGRGRVGQLFDRALAGHGQRELRAPGRAQAAPSGRCLRTGLPAAPAAREAARCGPVGGLYLDANAATSWRVSSSLKAGIALRAAPGGREIGFALIAHDGLSTQRQFFRKDSRYLGLEIRFDL